MGLMGLLVVSSPPPPPPLLLQLGNDAIRTYWRALRRAITKLLKLRARSGTELAFASSTT